jgi:hypothetical protein
MRPPPGGMPGQRTWASARQISTIMKARRGNTGRTGPSGGNPGAAAAVGGVAIPEVAGASPPPIAATALLHGPDNCAALRCRHCRASAPPGVTPEQCAMKSERQAARTALVCAALGLAVAGVAAAVDGFAAGFGAAGAAAGFGVVDGSGAAAGAAVVAGVVAAGAAGGLMALTAVWQAPESLLTLRLRHSKASLPPGVTPEQFAMKSERQDERMALT